jgi:hypothetical protein
MTRLGRLLIPALLFGAVVGCDRRTDFERVPIGARVEVTRHDGGVLRGSLTARDERQWHLAVGPAARSVPRDQITSIQLMDGKAAPWLPPGARFREVTLAEGTLLAARLRTAIGSDTSLVNDMVEATLTQALLVDDVEILPAGCLLTGIVTSADPSGRRRGPARLAIWFRKVWVQGRDETHLVFASLRRTTSNADVRLIRGSVLAIELDQDVDVRVPVKGAPR